MPCVQKCRVFWRRRQVQEARRNSAGWRCITARSLRARDDYFCHAFGLLPDQALQFFRQHSGIRAWQIQHGAVLL